MNKCKGFRILPDSNECAQQLLVVTVVIFIVVVKILSFSHHYRTSLPTSC